MHGSRQGEGVASPPRAAGSAGWTAGHLLRVRVRVRVGVRQAARVDARWGGVKVNSEGSGSGLGWGWGKGER